MLGLVGIGIYQIFFMTGIYRTTASKASLIMGAVPIFVAIFSSALAFEKIDLKTWGGIFLSFIGLFLIIRNDSFAFVTRETLLLGDLLVLGAAILWALYTVLAKPVLKKYSPLKVTAYAMISGTAFLLIFTWPELRDQNWTTLSPLVWLCFFYSSIFGLVVSYVLWYRGVSRIGPARTTIYQYLTPVSAVVFAMIFLSEKITVYQVIGALVVFYGVYVARIGRSARPE